jgi:hypothetical protein
MLSSPVACLKIVEDRLQMLNISSSEMNKSDIKQLENLHEALLRIEPHNFMRYQNLLLLLLSKNYGWKNKIYDRIIIYTERVETMNFIVANLRNDLNLRENKIQPISDKMTDQDLQMILNNFCKTGSTLRVLVVSRKSLEGMKIHHLCHRLIHFDIPWSLRIFKQRNGLIDNCEQRENPNICYMNLSCENKKINDISEILKVLIVRETNISEIIGEPALLMGKLNFEEEEEVTSLAIESGFSANYFSSTLDQLQDKLQPIESMMASIKDTKTKICSSKQYFINYISIQKKLLFL